MVTVTQIQKPTTFDLIEATIADINQALEFGALTSEQLVQLYLNRIEAYNQQGPALNAFITINPNALEIAQQLDAERRLGDSRSTLHGIPIVIKDVFNTIDLPTTGGTIALKDSFAYKDAFLVEQIRNAGAILLGTNNLEELHINAALNDSFSSLAGRGRNSYDPTRIPGGSSGGTASSVAANFATVGIGTDTGGSIRTPSSLQALVGIKPTWGLTSRDGMLPLARSRDVGGPIARTVTDGAILLDTLAGYDPNDPVTAASIGKIPASYTDYLDDQALQGKRIGVLKPFVEASKPEVVTLFNAAIADLQQQGAEVVEVELSELAKFFVPDADGSVDFNFYFNELYYNSLEYDLNNYLAQLGSDAPIQSAQELKQAIQAYPQVGPTVPLFFEALRGDIPPETDPAFQTVMENRKYAQTVLAETVEKLGLSAFVYPTSRNPAVPFGGEPYIPNTDFASFAGLPAISVPSGFVDGLPVGLEFLGLSFSESTLIGLAYDYEQATQHRVPPPTTPSLPGESFEYMTSVFVRGTSEDESLVAGELKDFDGNGDTVFAEAGNDLIDTRSSISGRSQIYGGQGNDTFFVGKNDRVFGESGDDRFDATDSRGKNLLSGGAGDDTFWLGSRDQVFGDSGDDRFFVQSGGENTLTGGAGADQFWIINQAFPSASNTITDFQVGTDVIGIQGAACLGLSFETLVQDPFSDRLVLSAFGKELATLNGITQPLTANNFVFA